MVENMSNNEQIKSKLFNKLSDSTLNSFKNKSKRLLREEISELMAEKEDKISKNDLIVIYNILKYL
jgi:hypothetical protein